MDVGKVYNDLMASGQMSDLIRMLDTATPFYNCTTTTCFPEGPDGPGNRGNLYCRQNLLCDKHAVMDGECHPWSHTSFIFHGKFLVRTQRVDANGNPIGEATENIYGVDKPGTFAKVYIEANVWHQFTALEDGSSMICVYAVRDSVTGEITNQFDGDRQPYIQKKTPWPVA